MSPQEIIAALTDNTGTFPLEAMREAVAQRDAITPLLLAELEHVADHSEEIVAESDLSMLPLFAMYLLAQFREPRALAPLIRICHLPQETVDFLLGDVITEGLGRILASVCDGNIAPIKTVIENPVLDEFVRDAGISALLVLVAEDALAREDVVDYLRDLPRTFAPESSLWDMWVNAADNIYPEELLPEIRAAFEADRVDTMWFSPVDIDATIRQGREAALSRLRQSHRYVTDAIGMLQSWACFTEKPRARS